MAQAFHELDMEDATRVLEAVIREECKELKKWELKEENKTLNERIDCEYGEIIELESDPYSEMYQYGIDENIIKNVLKNLGYDENLLNKLVEKGLLIRFEKSGKPVYRSVYMDLFVRSANLRTAEWTSNYILKPRLILVKSAVPFSSDRIFRVSLNSEVKEVRELVDLLRKELGEEKAEKYVEIMNAYLDIKGYQGFDLVQLEMIREAIEAYVQGKHIGIEAPTGFGKTEIFLFLILFVLMKNDFDPSKRILVLYPRKSLAIDNTNRLIVLAKLIEEKVGKAIPILIRMGDSSDNPQEKDGTKLREGSLRCPNGHELVYFESRAFCSNKSCKYSRSEFYIYDTKKYRILIKNKGFPEPLLIISNINTVANRLLDFKADSPDMNVEDFKSIHMIIMDEAHVYTNIFGGSTSAVLEGIKKVNPEVRFVGISATIPNREEFLAELFNLKYSNGNVDGLAVVSSVDIINKKKVSKPIQGFKLYLLGLFEIRPDISWQSYAQLWSVLASTYSLAYLNPLRSNSYQYQNIIFINNIPELNRFRDGFMQNLALGEPCGHVNDKESRNEPGRITSSAKQALENPFYIFVDDKKKNELCRPLSLNNSKYYWTIDETLASRSGIVFMNVAGKYEAFDKIKKGEWITVAATSSLELGVDYDGVAFVLNAGADDEIEIVQRLGRAGRSSKIPRITLGLIVSKNVPHHSYRINDEEYAIRLIYMLSGQQLDPNQRNRISIHAVKKARPVRTFKELLLSAIDLYLKDELTEDLIENIQKIVDKIDIKTRKDLQKLLDYIKQKGLDSCEEYIRKISRKQKFINESSSYLRYYFERDIDLIEKEMDEIRSKLDEEDIRKILNEKELNDLRNIYKEIVKKLSDIKSKYSEFKNKIGTFSTSNVDSRLINEIKDSIQILVENIGQLDGQIRKASDILSFHSNKLYIHELIRHVKNVERKTDYIRKQLRTIAGHIDKIIINIPKIKKFNIARKLSVLCLSSTAGGQDLRSLVFGYSSISNVSLNVEDLTLRKIPIRFYEYDVKKNSFVPVNADEEVNSDLFDLLTKFPPFYVFNYAWYVSKETNITAPKYGVVLLPIYLNKLKWSSRTSDIAKCLGLVTDKNYMKSSYINAEDIKELKACNIIHIEKYLLNNSRDPLIIEPSKDAKVYNYIFLKLGATKIRKINATTYNVLEDLIDGKITNLRNLANAMGIRYDVTRLSYARMCKAGFGISTDPFDTSCPFMDKCDAAKASNRKACKRLWSFSAKLMPKTFLDFKYRLFSSTSGSKEIILSPLLKASKISSLQINRDLTSVIVNVGDYQKYVPLRPKIRQVLYNTNAIKIEFDKDLTKKILEKIIFGNEKVDQKGGEPNKDEKLLNILLTKYYIYTNGRQNLYRGVRALSKTEEFKKFVERIYNNNQERDKFLDFAFAVLLHTLAHLLYEFVIFELKLDESLVDYYYDFENYDNSIYIYEKTSEGVLNLSSYILSEFNKDIRHFIEEFFKFVSKRLNDHDRFVLRTSSLLQRLRSKVSSSTNQNIRKAFNHLNDVLDNKMRKVGIEPDLYTFKVYVSPGKSRKNYSTRFDPAILGSLADIALGNFCVDGCSSCIMEDICHYPLIQNVITSRNLVEKFINEITLKSIDPENFSVGLRTEIKIEDNSDFGFYMIRKYATDPKANTLSIETAFFDENCLKVIEEILNTNPRLQVRLTVDSRNKENISKLKHLIEKLKGTNRFEFREETRIHTKTYVVQFSDGIKIIISGSWNCQQSSSKQNFIITL